MGYCVFAIINATMNVEGDNFESLALTAIARDLRIPLVRLRQLSFQLDNDVANGNVNSAETLNRLRLTVDETLRMISQLGQAPSVIDVAGVPLEPIQLDDLCTEVDSSLTSLKSEMGNRVICSFPCKPVLALGNREMLKNILQSFLADAVHYSNDNDPVELRIRRSSYHNRAVISICDNGPDFSLERSLAATINAVTPIKERPLMSSLNLIMANRLARAMHGQLRVCRGKMGTTIETYLPLSTQMSLLGEMQ